MLKEQQQDFESFIEVCRDPQKVKQIVLDPKNVNENSNHPKSVYWNDLSLMDGFASFVVFFATLDAIYPKEKEFDLIAHQYVLEIKEAIEKNGLPENGSLFSGTAGLCYAIAFASKQRSRYITMLSILEGILFQQLSEIYIPQIESHVLNRKPLTFRMYDLVQGIAGMGLYLLQNHCTDPAKNLIEKLLQLTVQITAPVSYRNHLVPGWVCPAEFLFEQEDQLANPLGIFNMGLAHGIPGLLGLMSIAWKAGFRVPGQQEAMETIIKWLRSKITHYNNTSFFRPRISFEQQIQNRAPLSKSSSNREAWCYGTPGVARTLYLAGVALNDADTIDFAAHTFFSIFDRSYEDWKLAGATFCHGTAGVLLITHLMAKDLKSHFLTDKVHYLEDIFFSFHNESYPFGFRDLDLCKDTSYYPLDKASFLTGSVGAWLSWLTTQSKTIPNWYYPFMIDYV